MSFGISNSVKSQQVQVCTPERLREAINSPLVAMVCADIKDAWEQVKRGEITPEEFEEKKGRLKKQLPILTPHATFRNGRRLNADAVPSGLSMYDLDHIPDPEGRWREIEPRKDELGIVMAHITPSAEGLRLIFVIPDGKTLAEAQRWMAEQLGDQKYDECVKDYARCSFIVPREYLLFMSDKLWEQTPSALRAMSSRQTGEFSPHQARIDLGSILRGPCSPPLWGETDPLPPYGGTTPTLGVESVTTASTAPALLPIEGEMPERQRGSVF